VKLAEKAIIILPGAEHPLQYAFVDGLQPPHAPMVYGTQDLDDEQVLDRILEWAGEHPTGGLSDVALYKLQHRDGYRREIHVDRYNRCPVCEQWSPCIQRKRGTPISPA
jgi:hypothetical protein